MHCLYIRFVTSLNPTKYTYSNLHILLFILDYLQIVSDFFETSSYSKFYNQLLRNRYYIIKNEEHTSMFVIKPNQNQGFMTVRKILNTSNNTIFNCQMV
jgi:hypothetical protein